MVWIGVGCGEVIKSKGWNGLGPFLRPVVEMGRFTLVSNSLHLNISEKNVEWSTNYRR